ncbi:MAG: hypothetical protein ACKPKE_22195 [Microcystis panniformis]
MCVLHPQWVLPEWVMISAIAVISVWGFSKRNVLDLVQKED